MPSPHFGITKMLSKLAEHTAASDFYYLRSVHLHGVSIDDLSHSRDSKSAKAKVSVAAQFKKPETGETWTWTWARTELA